MHVRKDKRKKTPVTATTITLDAMKEVITGNWNPWDQTLREMIRNYTLIPNRRSDRVSFKFKHTRDFPKSRKEMPSQWTNGSYVCGESEASSWFVQTKKKISSLVEGWAVDCLHLEVIGLDSIFLMGGVFIINFWPPTALFQFLTIAFHPGVGSSGVLITRLTHLNWRLIIMHLKRVIIVFREIFTWGIRSRHSMKVLWTSRCRLPSAYRFVFGVHVPLMWKRIDRQAVLSWVRNSLFCLQKTWEVKIYGTIYTIVAQ